MESKVLNSYVKSIDNDITTIKLIELKKSYTIEIKQGQFITEMQYGFDKVKALVLYGVLIGSELDIYIDKFSDVQRVCSLCDTKDTSLIQFDNGSFLCENCASEFGLE